jgi:hypothetical protein
MNKLVDLKCSQCGNLAGGNKRKIPVVVVNKRIFCSPDGSKVWRIQGKVVHCESCIKDNIVRRMKKVIA